LLVAAGTETARAATGWQADTPVAGAAGQSFDTSTRTVGLADSGAAVVVFSDGSDTVAATRESTAGTWTLATIGPGTAGTAPVVEMNRAGDAVVAWTDGAGISAVYRPSGGAWETFSRLQVHAGAFPRGPAVAIASDGSAIVTWEGYASGAYHVNAARRTAAGPWPATGSFDNVATESAVPASSDGETYQFSCDGTAAAIDDSGHAFVAWPDSYGSYRHVSTPTLNDQSIVCGMRSAVRSGGTWSGPTAITSRPLDGTYDRTSGASAPTVGMPVAAADPETGKLIVAYPYSDAAVEPDETANSYSFASDGSSTGFAQGTVGGGVTAKSPIPGLYAETPAVGAGPGFESLLAYDQCGTFSCTERNLAGAAMVAGGAPTPIDLSTRTTFNAGYAVATDVGGDGTGFFVMDQYVPPRGVQAWTIPAGGSASAAVNLFSSSGYGLGVAANCHGDALAAVAVGGQLHVRDYDGGNAGDCSGPPQDTTPPKTTITDAPAAKSTDRSPTFKFKSSEAGSTFQCKLDDASFKRCSSPKEYSKQSRGKHTFKVRATDNADNTDPTPAKASFKIVKKKG
jgi:hypothetical protein